MGTVTLNHSQVTGNTAVGGGGGIASGNLGKSTAIAGTLTLNFSKVNSNTVSGGSMNSPNSGGGIFDKSGTVVLNGSEVNWNTAPGSGRYLNLGCGHRQLQPGEQQHRAKRGRRHRQR